MITDIVHDSTDRYGYTRVTAHGGSRRERAAGIAATVRGRGLERVHVAYSETYGFLSATYATYAPR